jgi:branched-chain amino acid aminotransferase
MKVWFQNRLLDARQARLSVFDHSFLYGDGIYETLQAYDYRLFRWEDHFRRFTQSAQLLGLGCPWSSRALQQAAQRVLKANHQPGATLRITLSRGEGPLGLDPRNCPRPLLVIALHSARPVDRERGLCAALVDLRRTPPESMDPRIKSNNGINQILARLEAQQMGAAEGIFLNLQGYVTEGTVSNIFFVKRGTLYTPQASCGLLEGITRKVVLELARKGRFPLKEGAYRPAQLLAADEVFLTNSSWELMPVTEWVYRRGGQIRRKKVSHGHRGPVTRELHGQFRSLL